MKLRCIVSVLIMFSISAIAMEAPITTTKDTIQHLFAAGQRPADIVANHGYTHEQVRQALADSGTIRFNSLARSASAPDLTLNLNAVTDGITPQALLKPCPLSTEEQVRVFIRRGCGDEEILLRLSDTTRARVEAIRREVNTHRAFAANQQAMDHLDTLPNKNAKPHPKSFNAPNNNRRTVIIAAAAATGIWAIYSAYQVAKNTPEHEWEKLSLAGKCQKVVCGTPGQMAGHVAYVAKRVIGR